MNLSKRIIKSLAIGFGIFLSTIIIFAIVTAISAIIGVVPFFNGNSSSQTVSYNEKLNDFNSIEIDYDAGELDIKTGENFYIEAKNVPEKFKYEVKDGKLKIKNELKNKLFSKISTNINSKVVIYVPEGTDITHANIEVGAATINVSNIKIDNLKLELGAGKAYLNNVQVLGKSDIELGAGSFIGENIKLNELALEVGAGKMELNTVLTGKTRIECGVGKIELNILGYREMYDISEEKGLGKIVLAETLIVKEDEIYTHKEKIKLDIEVGLGKIDLNFVKK